MWNNNKFVTLIISRNLSLYYWMAPKQKQNRNECAQPSFICFIMCTATVHGLLSKMSRLTRAECGWRSHWTPENLQFAGIRQTRFRMHGRWLASLQLVYCGDAILSSRVANQTKKNQQFVEISAVFARIKFKRAIFLKNLQVYCKLITYFGFRGGERRFILWPGLWTGSEWNLLFAKANMDHRNEPASMITINNALDT